MSLNSKTYSQYQQAKLNRIWYVSNRFETDGDIDLAKSSQSNFLDNLDLWQYVRRINDAELARRLGVTQSTISKWKNHGKEPSFETMDKVAGILEIPTTFLFWDPTDPRVKNFQLQYIAAQAGKEDVMEGAMGDAMSAVTSALGPKLANPSAEAQALLDSIKGLTSPRPKPKKPKKR